MSQLVLKSYKTVATMGIAVILLSQMAFAEISSSDVLQPPVEIGAGSQQIPAGLRLKIRFLTALDSKTANVGEIFVAESAEDLVSPEGQLILPKGTPIRGRVDQVERPSFFSKGGLMHLTFDHVILPTGELKPMALRLDTASAKVSSEKNALYTDPGMGVKLEQSVDKGVDQFKSLHEKGVKAGKDMGGGLNMLLTVPTTTAAGVLTGTAVTTVNAAKAVFGKGESVTLVPGEMLIIDFSKAVTLQAQ